MKSRLTKVCLLVLLGLSLVGCAGTGQAKDANIPNMLHVVRYSELNNPFVPLDLVIHNAAQVQELYAAANALEKPIPSDRASNCPMDDGLEYKLDFLHTATSIQQMQLDATGCQILDLNARGYDFLGITTHDRRFTTPTFRVLLAKMLNLPSLWPPTNH